MSERGAWRLRIATTNTGASPADPNRQLLRFIVNGQASMGADLAFSNRTMERDWALIPPGRTVRDEQDTSVLPAVLRIAREVTVNTAKARRDLGYVPVIDVAVGMAALG